MASVTAVFYRGPSLLDGAPIVGLLSGLDGQSTNAKTGPVCQSYILRADVSPMDALRAGDDVSICGDCKLRGVGGYDRRCYVTTSYGPAQVWKRYAAGAAVEASWPELQAIVEGRVLRLGTYGDPAAIPFEVWKTLLASASSWLAYTHAWKRCDPRFKTICMASVDTIDEFHAAHLAGWRTFRVRSRRDDLIEIQNITARNKPYSQPLEFVCPASDEAQHLTTCADCRLCRGTSSPARSVAIYPHGKPTTLKAYGIKVDFFRRRAEAQPA